MNTKSLIDVSDNIWCIRREPFGIKPTNFSLVTDEFKSTVLAYFNSMNVIQTISFSSKKGPLTIVEFYASKILSDQCTSKLLVRHVLKHLNIIADSKTNEALHLCIFVHGYNRQTCKLKNLVLNLLKQSDGKFEYWERPDFILRFPVAEKSDW